MTPIVGKIIFARSFYTNFSTPYTQWVFRKYLYRNDWCEESHFKCKVTNLQTITVCAHQTYQVMSERNLQTIGNRNLIVINAENTKYQEVFRQQSPKSLSENIWVVVDQPKTPTEVKDRLESIKQIRFDSQIYVVSVPNPSKMTEIYRISQHTTLIANNFNYLKVKVERQLLMNLCPI